MSKRMGYRESLLWLIYNDDITWIWDDEPIPSVTVGFLADIFGKQVEDVIRDLKKAYEKERI